jgi:hypothetical protein
MKVPFMSRLNDSIWAGVAGAAIAHLDSIYTNPLITSDIATSSWHALPSWPRISIQNIETSSMNQHPQAYATYSHGLRLLGVLVRLATML